jgi:FkbM family methyltransferase
MKLIKKLLPFTYKRSIKEKLGVPSLHWSLQNLLEKKFYPANVVDIGAYEGTWTIDFLEVFPSSRILMVEAQKTKSVYLDKVKHKFPSVEYAIALLSSEDGKEKYFYENETASHVMESNVFHKNLSVRIVKTRTLDSLLLETQFPYPELLKLDVQGHEIEVLKGASKAIEAAEICLLEVSLLDLGDNNPLLLDVINFMDTKHFQAYDISQFIRRPLDKALYQLDMFFVKKNSYLIADKSWY